MESKDVKMSGDQKYIVKKWNCVTLWKWEGEIDQCAICRNGLMEICIHCMANQETDAVCNVAWGGCNHAFHFHCISNWLKK